MSAASEKTTLSKQVLSLVHHAMDEHLVNRIWEKDPKVWSDDPKITETIKDRLGWLDVTDFVLAQYKEITKFAEEVRSDGFTSVVVLGMGGSSLCVEVIRDTFGVKEGYPKMLVLDSTHPDQIGDVERAVDLAHTLFIVASKSGTTLEPNCYCEYFWKKLEFLGDDRRLHFCAITDPGTPLEKISDRDKFRHTFSNPPDIGGRYSVLSYFGIIPAALMGVDIEELLSRASSEAGQNHTEEERNAGLALGAFLGNGARIGRDKLTIMTDLELRSFGYWAEQLIAESTGKEGKGILPIEGESELAAEEGRQHRLYVHLTYGDHAMDDEEREKPYHLELHVMEKAGLGAQFFRWEFATALAGHYLGINPFDEPNVAESKAKTNEMLEGYDGKSPLNFSEGDNPVNENTPRMLDKFIASHVKEDSYIALMAYINRNNDSIAALQSLRNKLSLKYHVPVTVGFGPRFLHSTGQLHKGGPPTGIFIQLTDTPRQDLEIPDKPYTFGTLIRAQAIGNFEVLRKHERPAIHFDLGKDAVRCLNSDFCDLID